ncbi:MAG: penicillin-insensitive murein endopeptidase [Solirubrobacteraceae bacterium MAG38_C4-C5]|nr:penicillin-insensitive murein endopeptidase [Candidatus Siliceabacter maunaloa]
MPTRHRSLAIVALGVAAVAAALAGGAAAASRDEVRPVRPLALEATAPVAKQAAARAQARAWTPPSASEDRSRAVGKPNDGRLRNGLLLPAEGRDFTTFDSILERAPSREWRRYGTGRLLRVVYAALRDYREANPDAPRVLIGDLSRPRGGWFGREYGGLGHASHQNGLDIDIYYPRRDGRRRKPARASQVDRRLAQELVDAFVARPEVRYAFVGLTVGLTGPAERVQRLPHHDGHVHIRVLAPRG